MPDLISGKNKHMNADDRLEIQQCLDHGMTFKAIAQRIGKGPITVSKEVKKHLYTAIPFIKMENGAWIKADVALKSSEDKAAEKLATDKLGV